MAAARRGLGLVMAAVLTACVSAGSAPPNSGATPMHQGGYDIQRTVLSITPDAITRTIVATQTTTIRAEMELSELLFDANALTLDSVTADGVAMSWRTTPAGTTFSLPRALRAGDSVQLQFVYRGAPARGLVFEDGVFYTSYFSCDWMFCALNRPGDQFSFEVAQTASSGALSFQSPPDQDYPAHVQGFGSGALTQVHAQAGATELVYASAHASDADLRTMFADTPQMVAFYERAAGVAFPHRRYTQLLVRGSEAQEGAGFAILGDDVMRPILLDPHEDWAVAHELAHQYWGNLITCKDWTHFWLNEGVTTFMTATWKQERWGEDDYQREIAIAERRWAVARDAGWDRPLAFAGEYPNLRIRRAIQYSKGMLFMVALRESLGEDAFWAGLRAYTQAHAGGVVESTDLQRAMEQSSGRDLGSLFNAWVYEAPP